MSALRTSILIAWVLFWIYWLVAAGIMGAYFVHSARVEERLMADSFPTTYPGYRAKTKMLIPFVL